MRCKYIPAIQPEHFSRRGFLQGVTGGALGMIRLPQHGKRRRSPAVGFQSEAESSCFGCQVVSANWKRGILNRHTDTGGPFQDHSDFGSGRAHQ